MIQGLSMEKLLQGFEMIPKKNEARQEYERRNARAVAARAAHEHLQRLYQQGLISQHTWETISPLLTERLRALTDAVREMASMAPDVLAEELDTAWREKLRVQRSTLSDLRTDGLLSEEIYRQLITEVDTALAEGITGWASLVRTRGAAAHVRFLMTAIVQEQDVENALNALTHMGLPTTRLPSQGGLLGHRNVTLLVGLPEERIETAIQALRASSRSRVEFLPLPSSDISLPLQGTQVRVGGVTLFLFDVEHYEDF
jgi:uncharacterized protein YaaQ/ribosomal protein L19E